MSLTDEEDSSGRKPGLLLGINGTVGKKLADFYTGLFGWASRNEPGSDFYDLASGTGSDGGIAGGVFTGKGKLPHHL